MSKKEWLFLIFGVSVDQLTKWFSQHYLVFGEPVSVMSHWLSFQLVHNYGAAYGIFQNKRLFLLGVSLFVMMVCVVKFKKIATTYWSRMGIVFLLIGTVGNFMDRAILGYVVDFIDIRIFPVFNVADMSIDVGVFCFVVDMFKPVKETA